MGPPPAKKRRALVVTSSDEEEPTTVPRRSTRKQSASQGQSEKAAEAGAIRDSSNGPKRSLPSRSRRKREDVGDAQGVHSRAKTPSASPEKPRRKTSSRGNGGRGNSIHSFFNASTQRQRSTQISDVTAEEELDDLIQDDDIDVDIEPKRQALESTALSQTVQHARKRGLQSSRRIEDPFRASQWPSASQRFLSQSKESSVPRPSRTSQLLQDEDRRPWAEKYAPKNIDELAVHKKKVADVQSWLEGVLRGHDRKRLLILRGASGTGKTTVMQLLSKQIHFDILEWRNPVGSDFSSESFVSLSAHFDEFLGRGRKFGSLDLFGGDGSHTADASPSEPGSAPSKKKVILMEEFPNTFARSSSALQTFRSSIQQYLAANTPSLNHLFSHEGLNDDVTPLVMIISETLLSTGTSSADSFTAHRLLGPAILGHPGVNVIDFNPVATTFMTKALELVIQKEARISGRKRAPGPLVLKRLGEVGDIRSAIGSLEFLCLRGDDGSDWGSKLAFSKAKRGSKAKPALTAMEKESLEMVTQREASLGLFHAVGKVVYNKREVSNLTSAPIGRLPQPPNHLPHHFRPKHSDIDVDGLIDEIGTDTQTFIAALHENYILSCDGPTSEDSIDSLNGCIDALSDADLLSPDRLGAFGSGGGSAFGGRSSRGGFSGAETDNLRQDEIGFQVAVRGLLFSLPHPVKRRAPPSSSTTGHHSSRHARSGDAFKMFYPTSLRLWRQAEEIRDLVDLWVERSMRGQVPTTTTLVSRERAFAAPRVGGVETWGNRSGGGGGGLGNATARSSLSSTSSSKPTEGESATPPLLVGGASARTEMLLERLPYMAKITRARLSLPVHPHPHPHPQPHHRPPPLHHPHHPQHSRPVAPPPTLLEMEKLTSFSGITGPSDEMPSSSAESSSSSSEGEEEQEEQEEGEEIAHPESSLPKKEKKKGRKKHKSKNKGRATKGADGTGTGIGTTGRGRANPRLRLDSATAAHLSGGVGAGLEDLSGLVLSDDDIVDD
ncbi:MAG: hypothetical protein M1819_004605 [Sarea resinae]|nr:MAG: hypothetical protein M1819_004605 [Sarea resinae]